MLPDFRNKAPQGAAQEASRKTNVPVQQRDFQGVACPHCGWEGTLQQGGAEDEGGTQEAVSGLQVPTQAQEQRYGQVFVLSIIL